MRVIYRQGDIVLEKIGVLPKGVSFCGFKLSLTGETGNEHILPGKVYSTTTTSRPPLPLQEFIEVGQGGALMVHPEHPPMQVSQGLYNIRRVRTYTPDSPRDTID